GEKLCTVIEKTVVREIWDHWTGYYCYYYTNTYRLNFKYDFMLLPYNDKLNVKGTRQVITYMLPLQLANGTEFWYDYLNETSLSFIKPSFRTDHFFKLWMSCCQEAIDCCDNFMNNENIYPSTEYPCPAVWDGWSCFGPAKANTIEKVKCSRQVYSTDSDKTNYEVCVIAPVLRNRHNFNVIVLAVATVICFPAVVIFFSFRSFRTKIRFILHRNLILVIIIRNLLSIMTKKIIILDALTSTNNVMSDNGVPCRILAFFENVAKNGMYACMLADGFYLHKLIVRAFADEPNIMYLYGAVAVLSFLPSLIWATARGLNEGTDCWMVDNTKDQWIPDGFRIAILAVNFIFLLDIIRVMTLKLKHSNTSQQAKATLRATLFLIPLFGVHIVIITNRNIVSSNTCQAEDIYYYISYLMEGIQGPMVALLFCYMSSEVIGEIKNLFRKLAISLQQKYGFNFKKKQDNFPRTTAATYVDPYDK
ncbi:corticotropin-releasing factor receptor 2, partial [Asbolus verrucosus]